MVVLRPHTPKHNSIRDSWSHTDTSEPVVGYGHIKYGQCPILDLNQRPTPPALPVLKKKQSKRNRKSFIAKKKEEKLLTDCSQKGALTLH
jgi:hypothetical protein